jgi:NADH:ubiquinone oxidoreductase subunit D
VDVSIAREAMLVEMDAHAGLVRQCVDAVRAGGTAALRTSRACQAASEERQRMVALSKSVQRNPWAMSPAELGILHEVTRATNELSQVIEQAQQ